MCLFFPLGSSTMQRCESCHTTEVQEVQVSKMGERETRIIVNNIFDNQAVCSKGESECECPGLHEWGNFYFSKSVFFSTLATHGITWGVLLLRPPLTCSSTRCWTFCSSEIILMFRKVENHCSKCGFKWIIPGKLAQSQTAGSHLQSVWLISSWMRPKSLYI